MEMRGGDGEEGERAVRPSNAKEPVWGTEGTGVGVSETLAALGKSLSRLFLPRKAAGNAARQRPGRRPVRSSEGLT